MKPTLQNAGKMDSGRRNDALAVCASNRVEKSGSYALLVERIGEE